MVHIIQLKLEIRIILENLIDDFKQLAQSTILGFAVCSK